MEFKTKILLLRPVNEQTFFLYGTKIIILKHTFILDWKKIYWKLLNEIHAFRTRRQTRIYSFFLSLFSRAFYPLRHTTNDDQIKFAVSISFLGMIFIFGERCDKTFVAVLCRFIFINSIKIQFNETTQKTTWLLKRVFGTTEQWKIQRTEK